jgi:hypothetical protein
VDENTINGTNYGAFFAQKQKCSFLVGQKHRNGGLHFCARNSPEMEGP